MSALSQLFVPGDATAPPQTSDIPQSQTSTLSTKLSCNNGSFSLFKARVVATQPSWPVAALEAKFDAKWPSVGKGATIGRRHKHTGLAKLFAVIEHIEHAEQPSAESTEA